MHTAGILKDRASIAAWETTPPLDKIIPLMRVVSNLAISPGRSWRIIRMPVFFVTERTS